MIRALFIISDVAVTSDCHNLICRVVTGSLSPLQGVTGTELLHLPQGICLLHHLQTPLCLPHQTLQANSEMCHPHLG